MYDLDFVSLNYFHHQNPTAIDMGTLVIDQ
jgi:hypothetical protein